MTRTQGKYLKCVKPSEVADMLNVSIETVYRWIREGRINVIKIYSGKRVWLRIPEDEVKKLIGVQQNDC
jgi:excisionase family DNA binding protein